MTSRSSKKVLPQLGHGTRARSLNCFVAISLYSAMAMGSFAFGRGIAATGFGTGRRSFLSFSFSRSIHIFSHCGTWILREVVPYSRPQIWKHER